MILVAAILCGLDNVGMDETPKELDWVKERAGCTIEKMFDLLHQAIEEDVKSVNVIRNLPESRQFEVILSKKEYEFKVKMAETVRPFVRFAIEENCIVVTSDSATTPKQEYRISLSNEGRCKLTLHGEELEQWQVRRSALEGLFFPA